MKPTQLWILCALAFRASYGAAQVQTLTTLYSFTGQNGDGATPAGALAVGPGGVLYGTTNVGGTSSYGCTPRAKEFS